MQIQQQHQGAIAVLKLQGALIQSDAEDFKKHLEEAATKNLGRVVVDLSAVPFIDGRGLEVLVESTEALANTGRALKLCGANPTVREALRLTELTPIFELFEDTGSGIRSFT